MATKNTNVLYEKLGDRHKIFRNKVLKLKQSELSELRDLSQSTISNLDRGQMPNKEHLDYLASEGCNLNWLFTGIGPMKLNSNNSENDPVIDYESFKNNLDFEFSGAPIPVLVRKIKKIGEQFIKITNDEKLSAEQIDLRTKYLHNELTKIYTTYKEDI